MAAWLMMIVRVLDLTRMASFQILTAIFL